MDNKLWHTHTMAYYSLIKENYQATKVYEGNLNAYYYKWKKPIWKCSRMATICHSEKAIYRDSKRSRMLGEEREDK